MDSIDALGDRPERREAFHGELLAETDDAELKLVVESAARDLKAPIGLVSLVLDEVQYFRAHHGLPPDLAAARGIQRGASFCQFVVRDGDLFEVEDAAEDDEIPQFFVTEYGIRSYLGVPIHMGNVVLGSLCVLDTQPRRFTEEERRRMRELAVRVDDRLLELTTRRREVRMTMAADATAGALREIRDSLTPMRRGLQAGMPSLTAIRSFLRLMEFVEEGGTAQPRSVSYALQVALEALEASEEVLYNIDAAVADCEDCLNAVESLAMASNRVRLSAVLYAAQDLSRQATRAVGGAPLPDFEDDPELAVPRPFAVALLSTCLTQVANRVDPEHASGIDIRIGYEERRVLVGVGSKGLSPDAATELSEQLRTQLGDDPSVSISADAGALRIALHVASESESDI